MGIDLRIAISFDRFPVRIIHFSRLDIRFNSVLPLLWHSAVVHQQQPANFFKLMLINRRYLWLYHIPLMGNIPWESSHFFSPIFCIVLKSIENEFEQIKRHHLWDIYENDSSANIEPGTKSVCCWLCQKIHLTLIKYLSWCEFHKFIAGIYLNEFGQIGVSVCRLIYEFRFPNVKCMFKRCILMKNEYT